MKNEHGRLRLCKGAAIAASALAIAACSDNDGSGSVACSTANTGALVAIATAESYESSEVQIRAQTDGSLQCSLPATAGDTYAASYAGDVYQIARYQQDFLAKYSLDDISNPVYQYSVNGDDEGANPYVVVFASESKAYVIRRGGAKVWIVNPSATTEANFKLGELDLSAYDTEKPEASGGLLIDGKLFVLMERLTGTLSNVPSQQGYVAVFDTTTDTEIDTGKGAADNLMGIPLGVTNPTALQYVEDNGLIYVLGRGNYYLNEDAPGNPYTGGVVTIDPVGYQADLLLDDGDEASNNDFFTSLEVVSASKAYLLTYAAWQDTTLRTLNATTGGLDAQPVANMSNVDITTMSKAPDGNLWLGINVSDAEPRVEWLDTATDASVGQFNTTYSPVNFAFIEE